DYQVSFACWYRDGPETIELLEVSPTLLDPGDASFDAVLFGTDNNIPSVRHLLVVLVSPAEFERALQQPESRGGTLLRRLRHDGGFEVLVGAGSKFEEALR